MKDKEAAALIAKCPSVHHLCYGTFLQSPMWISEDVLAMPLCPLGFNAELGYVGAYLRQFFGVELASAQMQDSRGLIAEALPVITVIHYPAAVGAPKELEAGARSRLDRAEQLIAWVTGDRLTEFAFVTANNQGVSFRMVPPHSRRRFRLGFGNTGDYLKASIERLREAADEDPRFEFAISLFADATHEPNPLFKACRLFTVLESLAYALKNGETGSRRAVKVMLGLESGAMSNLKVDGRKLSYDRIEIAGRLRDKFFHGVPFRETDLIEEARSVFYLIENRPEMIADALLDDCELALARWANNASPARKAAIARAAD